MANQTNTFPRTKTFFEEHCERSGEYPNRSYDCVVDRICVDRICSNRINELFAKGVITDEEYGELADRGWITDEEYNLFTWEVFLRRCIAAEQSRGTPTTSAPTV